LAQVVTTAIKDESGRLMAFSNVTQDMTHRKEIEDQLRANAHRRPTRIVGITLDVTDLKGAEEEIHRLNQT